MKYKTVQAPTAEELDIRVQEMLDSMWELCGTPYNVGTAFYQCVTTGAPSNPYEEGGLSVADIATLSLLRGMGRSKF